MATVTDVEVANASFPNVRQDLNDILEALATNFSADAEPTTTYPNQFWYETDTNLLYLRNEANDAWITLASIDQTSGEWEPRTAVIQAIDAAGLSFKTDEGTTRVEIADDGSVTVNTSLDVDNIKIDGNTISSTDTNGDINITPDGTGKVVIDGLNYPTADGTDGQVLTTDGAGNIAFETVAGGGITEADQWRISTNNSYSAGSTVVSTNWERNDTSFQLIGSGMTESSGVFTFPSTGVYLVISISGSLSASGTQNFIGHQLQISTDGGSNWSARANGWSDAQATSAYQSVTNVLIVDVSSTANVKARMMASVAGNATFEGGTGNQTTGITFIRLGDT